MQATPFNNGGYISSGLIGGSLDIGGINTLSIAVAREKGLPLKIVAFGAMYNTNAPTTELMVSKSSPIQSARDLEGKVIGIAGLGGAPHVGTRLWIEQNGGDYTKVRFVEVPLSALPDALASGRVDAAVLPEPTLSQARPNARLLGKSYDGIGLHWINSAYCATTDWSNANPEVVHRFAQAIFAASAWANRNPVKVIDLFAKSMNIDPAPLHAMTYANFIEKPDVSAVQPVIDAAVKFGMLATRFPAIDLFSPAAIR